MYSCMQRKVSSTLVFLIAQFTYKHDITTTGPSGFIQAFIVFFSLNKKKQLLFSIKKRFNCLFLYVFTTLDLHKILEKDKNSKFYILYRQPFL